MSPDAINVVERFGRVVERLEDVLERFGKVVETWGLEVSVEVSGEAVCEKEVWVKTSTVTMLI